MRFVILLTAILLVPVFVAGHWWYFETVQSPALVAAISQQLEVVEIKEFEVSRNALDLELSGYAASADTLALAEAKLLRQTPFRISDTEKGLVAAANLNATIDDDRMILTGWVPDEATQLEILKRFRTIRPDLEVESSQLRVSSRTALIDRESGKSMALDQWILPQIDPVRAPATLRIERKDNALVIAGLLPKGTLLDAVLTTLADTPYHWALESDALKASPYVQDRPFDQSGPLTQFVRSFFGTPAPGSFQLGPDGLPKLSGPATRKLESEWLALLHEVTGPAKVETDFTYYPSIYHAPNRMVQSPLAPNFIGTLQNELEAAKIRFPRGSKQIQPEEATKLAALASVLLTAGPAARLIVGGHPDPDGLASVESSVARMRAETVVSFLLEMGVPTTYIDAMAFEITDDPSVAGTVEILIQ